ncbi:hypothetical protein Slin15195_G009140 [Septoria linicola]|uniref:Uncharacterized protein n=1 Tax=Septoria linicola TaxID=215465 RepID=A0A9Q9EE78_9PEZI|nr:hypothetical protein Slin14017_G009150 [Septoria linicola]USW47595.1 hypothetical protein Slin15195_G009140 [Septoria linicola]
MSVVGPETAALTAREDGKSKVSSGSHGHTTSLSLHAMNVHRAIGSVPNDRGGHATAPNATRAPPEPRPYKAATPEERVSRHPQPSRLQADFDMKQKSLWWRLWSFSPRKSIYPPSQDSTRGLEAARRVVKEGFLDPRYKRASRSFTAIMCALPIAIYTSYELFQRRFMGKSQKARPSVPAMAESQDD